MHFILDDVFAAGLAAPQGSGGLPLRRRAGDNYMNVYIYIYIYV